jgi:hypothetical protein
MCETSGPFPLRFNVEVDGVQQTSGCRSAITFNLSSVVPGSAGDVRRSSNTVYAVRMNIRSVAPNNDPKATRKLDVEVVPDGPPMDRRGPAVSPASQATVTVLSELDVPGGSGQVVVNDEVAFPRAGRSALALRPRAGENRVEATLVEGRGTGTWRFDLQAVRGLRPESLKVIAGDVAQLGGGAVTFRLRGRAGERIVLSFRVEP